MSWNPLHRLAARSRLTKARRAFEIAYEANCVAEMRNDSHSMNVTALALRQARREYLAAEVAYSPLPPVARRA